MHAQDYYAQIHNGYYCGNHINFLFLPCNCKKHYVYIFRHQTRRQNHNFACIFAERCTSNFAEILSQYRKYNPTDDVAFGPSSVPPFPDKTFAEKLHQSSEKARYQKFYFANARLIPSTWLPTHVFVCTRMDEYLPPVEEHEMSYLCSKLLRILSSVTRLRELQLNLHRFKRLWRQQYITRQA